MFCEYAALSQLHGFLSAVFHCPLFQLLTEANVDFSVFWMSLLHEVLFLRNWSVRFDFLNSNGYDQIPFFNYDHLSSNFSALMNFAANC